MVSRIAFACLLAAAPLAAAPGSVQGPQPPQQEEKQEKPKVPKDSLLVTVIGCLKGHVVRAEDVRQPDTTSGLTITSQTFRLSGKKDVMKAAKDVDGQRVEITGLIKKSALMEQGMKIKGGRVVIGGGSPTSASNMPSPAENVAVLDALTVQGLGGSCGSER